MRASWEGRTRKHGMVSGREAILHVKGMTEGEHKLLVCSRDNWEYKKLVFKVEGQEPARQHTVDSTLSAQQEAELAETKRKCEESDRIKDDCYQPLLRAIHDLGHARRTSVDNHTARSGAGVLVEHRETDA